MEQKLPHGWIWTTLGEIAEGINPGFPSGRHNQEGIGVPHIRPMNISRNGDVDLSVVKYVEPKDYSPLMQNDVLFNNTNSPDLVGKTTYIRQNTNWAYSNHMTRIRLRKNIASAGWVAYILHYLFLDGYFKLNCRHHVNQASISTGFLTDKFSIPLPPLPDQERIVRRIESLFTRLDAGVAGLMRAKAALKRYRASVLKAACEGRLVPQDAEDEPAEAMLRQLGQIPSVLTGLPKLPQGWCWIKAEQICEFITKGTTPKSDKLFADSGDIPFVKVYNLTFDGILNFSIKPTFISKETHNGELTRSRVVPGDILMNIVGPPLGKVSIVPETFTEWNINQAIARFRPAELCNKKYLSIVLRTESVLNWAVKRAKATAGQFNLTLEICRDLPIPVPPLSEQDRIVTEVERRLSVVQEVEAAVQADLARAGRLRQAILKRAFEGRLANTK